MDDLISRQAAIDAATYGNPQTAWQRIEALPSVQPERKTGKWIKMSDADGIYYCCSECGEELYRKQSFDRDYDLFPKKESIERTNYCPNCGAKMEVEHDRA